MTAIDLACPKCGRVGAVPREKAHSRLVCPKCLAIFHMNAAGRAVIGEPPVDPGGHDHQAGRHQDAHHREDRPRNAPERDGDETGLPKLTPKRLVIAGGLAIACFLGYSFFSVAGPTDNLTARAQAVVDALAHDQLAALKENASSATTREAERFYKETVHPRLEELRKQSTSKDLTASVLVIELNAAKDKAQVLGLFAPIKGSSRDEAIQEAANITTPKEVRTAEFTLWWVKDESGRWRLDGRHCLDPQGKF